MIEINNKLYYKLGDVAAMCSKTAQTVALWYSYNDMLIKQGKPAVLPKPIEKNGIRYWTKEQADKVIAFGASLKKGQLSAYTRPRLGKRGEEIAERIMARKEQKAKLEAEKQAKKQNILNKSMTNHRPRNETIEQKYSRFIKSLEK